MSGAPSPSNQPLGDPPPHTVATATASPAVGYQLVQHPKKGLLALGPMEQGADSDPPHSPPLCAMQGTPLAMSAERAELLVSTLASTARLVHRAGEAQKSAQLACFHAGQALAQAGEVLSLSKQSYLQARRLGDGLLGSLPQPDYRGLFQCLARPPLAYEEFRAMLRRAESTLLHPIFQSTGPPQSQQAPSPDCHSLSGCAHDSTLGRTQASGPQGSPCARETDEDSTEEEEGRSLQVRGRDPSRHRQVEAVRLEERMGGAFVTQRRRSPRRSPSGSLEALSPLVSEQELSTIQPLMRCPSRQGGPGKFLSKVTRRDRPPGETSDSDTDQSEALAKDRA
ncbi:uncharacterized protein LOC123369168 [Mauremys mutica]|nr:uncharacterized protein LOC123369168 [Mauremys mutica]